MVTVRGTVHWLTHADGPARALLVDPAARARLPRVLGTTGKVAWVTDAERGRRHPGARRSTPEQAGTVRTIAAGDLGNVPRPGVVAGRGQARRRRARRPAAARSTSSRARPPSWPRNDDGEIEDISWSPDSAWLAWAQPGPQPLARIRLARVEDGSTADVTDGRFVDSHPVFTTDGLYLAFMSRRTFDPIYDAHSFDLSFPLGDRPVPGAAGRAHAVAVRSPAGRPSGRRRGKLKRLFPNGPR